MKRTRSQSPGHDHRAAGDDRGTRALRDGLPPASSARRLVFRVAAAIVVPLFLLAAAELALRLAGYGHPTSFFVPLRITGRDMLVENEQFGLQFFPAAIARSPSPVVMAAKKTPGTYRIFVLGESAALGDPKAAFGFSRYLQVLLAERFPGAQFEVVNVAMTAINSHVVLPIARECARQDGDVWLIYAGNNEFIGPFGACTIFGPQALSTTWVRARLALGSTRLGQALEALSSRFAHRPVAPKDWTGLRMFMGQEIAADDPRRDVVYRSFGRNLEDIVRAGLAAHARVVLSAAAVNLRDCPPFASKSRPSAVTGLAAWEALRRRAEVAVTNQQPAEALALWREAVAANPGHAETVFRLAQAELAVSNRTDAALHFAVARDLDALPFRTDARLAAAAAEVARRHAAEGVRWLDVPALLARASPDQIPGQESFYEHVHLNFDGNYRLAIAFAEEVVAALPAALTSRATAGWASQSLCERRLGLSDWNRQEVMETIVQRLGEPPYTGQWDHEARLRKFRARWNELKARLTPAARDQALAMFEEAIRRAPNDHRLHENCAEFLELSGNPVRAQVEWQRVCDLIPHHFSGWYQTGRLLVRLRQFTEARDHLQTALKIRPDLVEAKSELGRMALAEGHPEEALRLDDEVARARPEDARVQLDRANALAALHRRPEALAALREAIRLRPSFHEARYLLGVEHAVDQQLPEAQAEFEEVIRLRPDHVLAHLNLGVALARQNRLAEAETQFEETLRLDPQNQQARTYLEALRKLDVLPP
ncbi:MAG: tetratricopeptide repeat protein [Verrucomicrobiota bacterium]